MATNCNIMIMGASYGSLLATKLLLAGHDVTLVCLPEEASLINREGTEVRIKLRDEKEHRSIFSRVLPGKLDAVTPADVDIICQTLLLMMKQTVFSRGDQ